MDSGLPVPFPAPQAEPSREPAFKSAPAAAPAAGLSEPEPGAQRIGPDAESFRWRGSCRLAHAFDIGQAVDLAEAARRLSAGVERSTLRHRHRAPSYFQFEPPPLRLPMGGAAMEFGPFRSETEVELLIYDFGAVSVSHRLRFEGELERWVELSCALFDTRVFLLAARRYVVDLMAQLGGSVQRPVLAEFSEDYAIFEFEPPPQGVAAEELVARHGEQLARLLRAEQGVLSGQEVSDALAVRVAFAPGDLVLIDWNGAVVIDREPEDVRAVLELANVQLLEMRHLDQDLDLALDRAYEVVVRGGGRSLRVAGLVRDRDAVAAMQVEGAILFERVGNALKLLNDQYLARVYRQALQRLRLSEWNGSVLRKLDTLDSLYQKLQDRTDTRRMEVLEWIIILLIAISIVLPVFGWPK